MQTTFITVFLAGLAYIVLSWMFGSIFGGEAAHLDDSGSDMDGHETSTISIFSPRIIAIFCVGFGAAGYLFRTQYDNQLGAILAGLATGTAFAALFLLGMKLLHNQQASSNIDAASAVGQTGVITTDFSEEGLGEVGVTISGQYVTCLCQGSEHFSRGTRVIVKNKQGPYLFVEKAE